MSEKSLFFKFSTLTDPRDPKKQPTSWLKSCLYQSVRLLLRTWLLQDR